MSNSPLISYTRLSPNHSGARTHAIDRITPHCVVGQLSCEAICRCFPKAVWDANGYLISGRAASCNYGIGKDGRISLCVEEKYRSWCSSSNDNDQRAVTIECASDAKPPYAFNAVVYAKLIELCTDICRRHGKTKLLWLGDKAKTLRYAPADNEMVLTVHRWFANKSCPGDWMYARMGDLAKKVTEKLGGGSLLYRVQLGAFTESKNADALAKKLKAAGFESYVVKAGSFYKVQTGAFRQKGNAEQLAEKLSKAGFGGAYITT